MKKLVLMALLSASLFGAKIEMFDLSFHGKFCGKNTPEVTEALKNKENDFLRDIEPIDVIDEACKAHDICYLENGDRNEDCDAGLVTRMKQIDKRFDTSSCRMLSGAIILYFDIKNNNPLSALDSDEDTDDKLVEVSRLAAKNMFDMAAYSSDLALNYFYTKPIDYITDPSNNKERSKQILQVFPPRYTKCTLKE